MNLETARLLAADLQQMDSVGAIHLSMWPVARQFIADVGAADRPTYEEPHKTLDVHIALDVPADVADDDLEAVAEDAFVQINEPEVVTDQHGNTRRVPTLARARMSVTVTRP